MGDAVSTVVATTHGLHKNHLKLWWDNQSHLAIIGVTALLQCWWKILLIAVQERTKNASKILDAATSNLLSLCSTGSFKPPLLF